MRKGSVGCMQPHRASPGKRPRLPKNAAASSPLVHWQHTQPPTQNSKAAKQQSSKAASHSNLLTSTLTSFTPTLKPSGHPLARNESCVLLLRDTAAAGPSPPPPFPSSAREAPPIDFIAEGSPATKLQHNMCALVLGACRALPHATRSFSTHHSLGHPPTNLPTVPTYQPTYLPTYPSTYLVALPRP